MVDGTRLLPPDDLDERMCAMVREGRRDDAVVLFSTEAVGLPTAIVEGMRASPGWGWLTALAHTLPYDLAVHHGYRLPTERLAELELPLLALDGSESFPWIRATAQAMARAIPGLGIAHSRARTTASCRTRTHSGPRSSSSSADHNSVAYERMRRPTRAPAARGGRGRPRPLERSR